MLTNSEGGIQSRAGNWAGTKAALCAVMCEPPFDIKSNTSVKRLRDTFSVLQVFHPKWWPQYIITSNA